MILQERTRTEIALGLRTKEEGTGKGFFERNMGKLLGNHYMQLASAKHIVGNFNPHLQNLLRVTADEALFVGNQEHRNVLFSLITEPKLTIEPKNISAYQCRNYLNISLTSNADKFVPVSGTARRFFLPDVSKCRAQDLDYFHALQEQLDNGGHSALLYHLLHDVDLSDFDAREVPKTASFAEQAALNRDSVDGLVELVCHNGRVPCEHPEWPGYTVTSPSADGERKFDDYLAKNTDKALAHLRSITVIKRLAQDWGCTTGGAARKRDGSGRTQGIQWPPLDELRAAFEQRNGPQVWLHPEVTAWTAAHAAEEPEQQEVPF